MILSLWFSPCWKVFCSLLSGDGSGRLDSWQTTSWANQLKTFIGDTFGMYKISSSNQKKNVWWGRRDERGGLKHFELHSAIGTTKQLSPVASAVKRWRESTKIIITKWRKVHVNALTSNQAEEKMKPVDFFFFLVCQFCLPVIHFSSCLFCNIQRKNVWQIKWKPALTLRGGQTASSVRQTGERRSLLKAKTGGHHIFCSNDIKKKEAFSTCTRQPTESTEVILGGARAAFFFSFVANTDHHFRKTKTKTKQE